ncbi:hypothetical protein C4A76_18790 [Brevibacillus laterosporus]|nr:hypothetical protein C4A76_18790 [Brevibacillus laterosporus]
MPATIPSSAEFFYTPFTLMLDKLADVLLNEKSKPKALATFEEGYQVQPLSIWLSMLSNR